MVICSYIIVINLYDYMVIGMVMGIGSRKGRSNYQAIFVKPVISMGIKTASMVYIGGFISSLAVSVNIPSDRFFQSFIE